MHRSESKIGAFCAVAGALALFAGTYLHPMHADPNDFAAAFAEYAADRWWIASHLLQWLGVVLMVGALLVLARDLEAASGSPWPRLATGAATASLAVASALQAVDGIALKFMVDHWNAAPPAQREAALLAAIAVRQVEVGLASLLSLVLGLTMTLFGVALRGDLRCPRWMAAVAVLGGISTAVAGVVMAYTGFSGLAMALSMPASLLLLAWMLALGIFMWRRPATGSDEQRRPAPPAGADEARRV